MTRSPGSPAPTASPAATARQGLRRRGQRPAARRPRRRHPRRGRRRRPDRGPRGLRHDPRRRGRRQDLGQGPRRQDRLDRRRPGQRRRPRPRRQRGQDRVRHRRGHGLRRLQGRRRHRLRAMSFARSGSLGGMKTTHVVDHAQADITYDVHRPEPGGPPLMMIGQPMDAGGFRALAEHLPDRTVDHLRPARDGPLDSPRRSRRRVAHGVGGGRARRDRRAGRGPVDLFASSGGAVTALALVAAHPHDVAHARRARAAAVDLLPDTDAARRASAPSRTLPGHGLGRGDGRVHGPHDLAGRVHRRVLRPTRSRSRAVRTPDRRRRHPR